MKCSGVLPTTQFAYQKGLGTCDALLHVSHTLHNALESGQEARIMQIDFSAAFDRVNHLAILYKLGFVGIGGSVLWVLEVPDITGKCYIRSAARQCFGPIIVPPVHFRAFLDSGK